MSYKRCLFIYVLLFCMFQPPPPVFPQLVRVFERQDQSTSKDEAGGSSTTAESVGEASQSDASVGI